MSKEEIIEKTNFFLSEEFEVDIEVIKPDGILKDTLGLDSLDYVDLVVAVEGNFGVRLAEPDFVGLSTFEDFYRLIQSKVN